MDDWLYTDERLQLRADCLGVLLHKYGWELTDRKLPRHSMESMQTCAHDWVSQGNPTIEGIDKYFRTYYDGSSGETST